MMENNDEGVEINQASSTRYRDIKIQLRKIRTIDVHESVSQLSYNLMMRNFEPTTKYGTILFQWQLAFISVISILESDDEARKNFTEHRLVRIAKTYNNLLDPMNGKDLSSEPKYFYEFFVRLSNLQFPMQASLPSMYGRALILFEDIPKQIGEPNININEAVKEIYGVGVNDLITIGSAIMICVKETGRINYDMLRNSMVPEIKRMHMDGTLDKALSKLTTTYEEVQNYYDQNPLLSGMEQYTFNYLRTKPLVVSSTGTVSVPVLPYLIEATTTGIYYALMDKFKSEHSNPFMQFFGKDIFEKYVGMLFELFVAQGELIEEFKYGKDNKLTSDWMVIRNDEALFIECKTSSLSIIAKTSGDLTKVNQELSLRIVHALEQMIALRDRAKLKSRGLELLDGVSKYHFLVVMYDDFYLANSEFIRDLVNSQLSDKGIAVDFTYDVASAYDIECLEEITGRYHIIDFFNKKHTKKEWVQMDVIPYMNAIGVRGGNGAKAKNNSLLVARRERYLEYFRERQAEMNAEE